MLDAPGLLESLGLREVNLQRTPNGWIARRGPKQLALTDHELVKLVFGPEKYADFAPDLFPIDFYQWPLDIV